MAAGQKLYPRATVKKIVKAHSKRNVSKNVDVLVGFPDASPFAAADHILQIFLDYALFLQTYAVRSIHDVSWQYRRKILC
jgi:hypothetical protein